MSRWTREIENDLNWREAELASLKAHAISTRDNQVAHRAALRSLWAMLYAHYEGFTKFCWDLVLDEIQRSKTKREDLIESVAIASLESFFATLRSNSTSEKLWACFLSDLPAQLQIEAEFPEKYRFSTDSNLWPEVFRRETSKLGITCRELDRSETLVKALVARRNKIAHGETMTIKNLTEYEPFEHAAILVMHELAVAVLELLDEQLYTKINQSDQGAAAEPTSLVVAL